MDIFARAYKLDDIRWYVFKMLRCMHNLTIPTPIPCWNTPHNSLISRFSSGAFCGCFHDQNNFLGVRLECRNVVKKENECRFPWSEKTTQHSPSSWIRTPPPPHISHCTVHCYTTYEEFSLSSVFAWQQVKALYIWFLHKQASNFLKTISAFVKKLGTDLIL